VFIHWSPVAAAAVAVSEGGDDDDNDFAVENTKPKERPMTLGEFGFEENILCQSLRP
jgi:hypothetical protein